MLTREQLMELDRALADQWVLSVYLDGDASDPAERTAWKRRLDVELARLKRGLRERTHAERERFDETIVHLQERLAGFRGFLPDASWVGFITSAGVIHAESLHVSLPTLAVWQRGMRIGPYFLGLPARGTALVIVVDSRMARIYRSRDAAIELLDRIHAISELTAPEHLGHPPRLGFHTGTRGSTGTELAERELRAGRERMMRELGERLSKVALPDEPVLVGGIAVAAAEAIEALPKDVGARTTRLPIIDVHSTDARLATIAAAFLADRRDALDLRTVTEVLARAAEAGRGLTTLAPTREALRTGAVDQLCLSERFVLEHPEKSDEVLRSALRAGAEVLVVRGAAAERLDADAKGIAARLRYVPWASAAAGVAVESAG